MTGLLAGCGSADLADRLAGAARFLQAHPPAGTVSLGIGSLHGSVGTIAEYVTDASKSLPYWASGAELAVVIVPRRHGGSLIRADAQIIAAGYQLRFAASAGPQATVAVSPTGCLSVAVRDGGRPQPTLWDPGNRLIALLHLLLGRSVHGW